MTILLCKKKVQKVDVDAKHVSRLHRASCSYPPCITYPAWAPFSVGYLLQVLLRCHGTSTSPNALSSVSKSVNLCARCSTSVSAPNLAALLAMSMFRNLRGVQINDGHFQVIGGDSNNYYMADPLRDLWEAIKDVGAHHNSETRYPPPQCHPDTRKEVLNVLHEWIHSPYPEDRILWLHGPAGAGKSAIAQTVADMGQQEKYLISSFFFSRSDTRRNTPKYLFLTIAYGLASSIPELQKPIGQAIRRNPAILQASLDEQFQTLILEPCRSSVQLSSHARLVVVDGLDECSGSLEQQRVLFIIAAILSGHTLLRFLICSRPEPTIRETFNTDDFRPYLHRVSLDESFRPDRDIKAFLINEFKRIREHPRNVPIQFPAPWPARGVIYELVQKASGQFIYAATVIKFVDNEYCDPCAQLELVLHPKPYLDPDSGSPFHDLDVLYHQILSSNPQRSKVRDVIRAISSDPMIPFRRFIVLDPPYPTPRNIEALLSLREGEVMLRLRGMHSILDIRGPDDKIRPLHASFSDFYRDKMRSGYFYVGEEPNKCSYLASWFLRAMDHYPHIRQGDEDMLSQAQRQVSVAAWSLWGSYCWHSDLHDDVLDALRNVSFARGLGYYSIGFLYELTLKIRTFFVQTELMLQRLSLADSDVSDIVHRFSNFRRGFRVKFTRQHGQTPDTMFSRRLDDIAIASGYSLLGVLDPERTRRMGTEFLGPEEFRVISLGNECGCTRAGNASSRASLPCSESTSSNVYHIQLSVALRAPAYFAMRDVESWCLDAETHCLRRYSCAMHLVLDICGPCPEFLELLPPLLSKMKANRDKDRILKWLQSFSPEYAPRTSVLVKQLQDIKCIYA